MNLLIIVFAILCFQYRGFKVDFDGKSMWYSIQASDLLKSPGWQSNDELPPLTPRKAMQAGNRAIVDLETKGILRKRNEGFEWAMQKLALSPVFDDKWIYEITYTESVKPGYGATGHRPSVTIVVLMDGTYVMPTDSIESSLDNKEVGTDPTTPPKNE